MTFTIGYFDVEIKKIINETPDVKTFHLQKPKGFHHAPGQFCWLTIPSLRNEKDHFPRTPMAIASGINEKELVFSFRNWGFLTEKLFSLQSGDYISISEPLGTSVPLELFESRKVICIAGGTGITPVRSLIRSIKSKKKPDIYYGARSPSDILYKKELHDWESHIIVEQTNGTAEWKGPLGYVTKLLPSTLDSSDIICYICGPYPMMQNAVNVLRKIGFPDDKLYVSLEKVENNEVIGPVFPVSDPNVTLL